MEYLDFELPVKELQEQIAKCQAIGDENSVDVTETCKLLTEKLEETKNNIYCNLSPWQRVQLSRHPSRPYALDYINALCGNSFLELHGDRNFADDKAMVGGLGKLDNQTFMFIGTQKGYNTKTRQYRNFGMAKPEGYRKALRLMKTAGKISNSHISFIDTPVLTLVWELRSGARVKQLPIIFIRCFHQDPIIVTIIGEGASGGALGIGVEILFICWKILGTQLFLLNLALRYYGGVGNTKKQPQKL